MTQIPFSARFVGALEITTTGEGFGVHAHDEATAAQAAVLLEALVIYAERNERYKDNWRRMGWRGALIRLRERVERAWDYLWDAEVSRSPEGQAPVDAPAVDDVIDLINFAAFLIRGVRGETTRDGSWW